MPKEYKLVDFYDITKVPEPIVKNAGEEEVLQWWQIEEIKKCQKDPKYFINTYCWCKGEGGIVKFILRKYQEKILEAVIIDKNIICQCGRQLGKTQTMAMILLYLTLFDGTDGDYLICAHKQDQALEIVGRIKDAYERLPVWLKCGVIEWNKQSIKLENRNRIISRATTPSAANGLSIKLVYADEFSKIPSNVQQEFYGSILPTLSSTNGKMVITSTPQTDFDLFSELWRGSQTFLTETGEELDPEGPGINGFKGIFAIWSDVPGRGPEWKEKELAKLNYNEELFAREYECVCMSIEGTLINGFNIKELSSQTKMEKPLRTDNNLVRWYKEPEPFEKYILALDPSTGIEGDFSCIQILRYPDLEQIGEFLSCKVKVEEQTRILYKTLKYLHDFQLEHGNPEPELWYTFERNAIGEGVRVEMDNMLNNDDIEFPGLLISDKGKGLVTTNSNKGFGCTILKRLIENDKLKIHSKEFVRQLSYFVKLPGSNNFKAKEGEHDDAVMAMVLACRIIEKIKNWDNDIVDGIYDSVEEETEEPIMPVIGSMW